MTQEVNGSHRKKLLVAAAATALTVAAGVTAGVLLGVVRAPGPVAAVDLPANGQATADVASPSAPQGAPELDREPPDEQQGRGERRHHEEREHHEERDGHAEHEEHDDD